MDSFSDFELLPTLMTTLNERRLQKPTEIQIRTIPRLLAGKSLVGVSETGSGKTLAYALPLLHLVKTWEKSGTAVTADATPVAVVVVPTRELGEQVAKVLKSFTHDTRLRVRPALGGMAFEQARRNVSGPFEILLATPGRLLQLLKGGFVELNCVRFLVFDEADQMLDPGFLPDSKTIVEACSKDLQIALFSATVSKPVQDLMHSLLQDAEVIRSAGSGKIVASLKTDNRILADGQRWPVLEKILKKNPAGGTLIFVNTRDQCDRVAKLLTDNGFQFGLYRGEMDKAQRRTNFKNFRDGHLPILIATDLGGRGLDVENIQTVINYHLPREMENYLHRVGRTARAGRSGLVINLVTERDEDLMAELAGKKKRPASKQPSQQRNRPASPSQGRTTFKPTAKAKPQRSFVRK